MNVANVKVKHNAYVRVHAQGYVHSNVYLNSKTRKMLLINVNVKVKHIVKV